MPPVKNLASWLPTAALSASGYRVEVGLLPLSLLPQAPLCLLYFVLYSCFVDFQEFSETYIVITTPVGISSLLLEGSALFPLSR